VSTNPRERVYTLATAPEHPLAAKYGISERQFRRWVQAGKISYARPGGQRVLLTGEDIEQAILGTRVSAGSGA
jgi:excisionase family DNA binding protein